MKRFVGTVLGAALVAAGAQAEFVSVMSPDGKNEIRLLVDDALQISVLREGKTRLAPAPISLTVDGKGVLGKKPKITGRKSEARKTVFSTPLYKKAQVADDGNELTVSFEGGYQVVLHARNDGVAYRFKTQFDGTILVKDEQASLVFPSENITAYVGYTGGLQSSWESIYEKTTVGKIAPNRSKLIYLPLTLQYPDGGCMCVTESDLLDYPGWNLGREKETLALRSWMAEVPVSKTINNDQRHRFVKDRENYLAKTAGTRAFPWRVFILADQPIQMVESDIVMALATPQKLKGDLSWIKPGKVAWEWWNDWNVSGVNFRAGCNTETYKYYIDFAAENKIEYVIMDEGWSVKLKIMEINPDVDVEGIVKYANEKGVGIILWCSWPQLVERQHEVFKKYSDLGVKGFKIDFMDRDDQFVTAFLEKTAAIAADYRLLVDYHGMYKPTGMQRTYPNVINFEGVHGLEQCKWEKGSKFPANDCRIIFTRMIAGPMDYTPGSMRNQTKGQYQPNWGAPTSQGTRCHQLALMSLFEAPLQMLCDSPTQYIRNQECTDFMAKVPTVWDETIGLAGEIEKFAVIARRKGDVWYLSGITDWDAREVVINTSFLKEGEWSAEIFQDGINADRDATDYLRRKEVLKAGDPITLKMATGGGWTARLTKRGFWGLF